MKRLLSLTAALGFLFIWTLTTQAATLPGTVLPGQIEKQFKPEPQIRVGESRKVAVPELDPRMPANAAEIRFQLNKVSVEGSTVYSEQQLQSVYSGYLGKEASLADVYKIAALLTAKYRNDGYILSQVIVPAQVIEGGEAKLKAVEGYIDNIILEGVDGDRRKLIQRYSDKIKASRPLRNDVLERYLLLINDLPGAFGRATIRPSKKSPAASELIVQYSLQKLQGGVSADNRGGETLGPLRLSADVSLNSVLGIQESTTLRYATSGNDKLNFLMVSHDEIIGSWGGKLNLSFSGVESNPKDTEFIPLNLATSSRTGSLTYSQALIRSRSQNLFVRANFTAYEGKTELFDVEDTKDKIRAVRIGATYDKADYWMGTNLLDIEVSQGISGLGSSKNGDPMLSQPSGKVDFTKAAVYAARLQTITSNISLLVAANAQYAFTDLLSSELFSFGGEQFGRGYDPSELVGDTGAAGKAELRYTGVLPSRYAITYTGYAFYDIGIVHQRSPGDLPENESAASAGAGLRLNVGPYVYAYVEVAKPLTRDVAAEGDRDPRLYGAVSIRF